MNLELNKFWNCNCMDFMATVPDKYFELDIVDPPYGIGDFNQSASRNIHKKIKWNNATPGPIYFKELERIAKNRIIWGVNYYGSYINDVGRIIHDKVANTGSQLKELSDADIASHSFGVNIKMYRYGWRGNVQGDTINWKNIGINSRIHPCQKPVQLYQWLLQNYAKPGDKIFDSHVGSASSLIACHLEGFEYIGCELDPDYYKEAKQRLEAHTAQRSLFENV